MFKKILACSDGSEYALRAVETAAEIGEKFGSEIVALYVDVPVVTTVPFTGPPEATFYSEASIAAAMDNEKTAIAKTATPLGARSLKFESRVETGHPVDVILRAAADEGADLIVLGSRGLGGFDRLLLGSVSTGVLHHAKCPVLIVR